LGKPLGLILKWKNLKEKAKKTKGGGNKGKWGPKVTRRKNGCEGKKMEFHMGGFCTKGWLGKLVGK